MVTSLLIYIRQSNKRRAFNLIKLLPNFVNKLEVLKYLDNGFDRLTTSLGKIAGYFEGIREKRFPNGMRGSYIKITLPEPRCT